MIFKFMNRRPSLEEQGDIISNKSKSSKSSNNRFNIDSEDVGRSRKFDEFLLSSDRNKSNRYAIDRTKIVIGKGDEDFRKAIALLKKWEHFKLKWTSVDKRTEQRKREKVCVLVNIIPFVYIFNPLEIVYVEEEASRRRRLIRPSAEKTSNYYAFAHATLQGHMLAGEEKFTIEKSTNDGEEVFFKIDTFSKPGNIIASASYPIVRILQKAFHFQAAKRMKNAMMLLEKQKNSSLAKV